MSFKSPIKKINKKIENIYIFKFFFWPISIFYFTKANVKNSLMKFFYIQIETHLLKKLFNFIEKYFNISRENPQRNLLSYLVTMIIFSGLLSFFGVRTLKVTYWPCKGFRLYKVKES